MSSLPEDEERFLEYLTFGDLRDRYLEERDALLANSNAEAAKLRPQREKEIRDEIKIDREHRKILNACIYPFATKISPLRKLGYYFLRAAPLLENGVSNLDFLLYKKTSDIVGTAIFGEAKGTVADASAVVRQTAERVKTVETNREYCTKSYLGAQKANFEYVLGVSSVDSNNVAKATSRRGGGLIIWHSEKSPNPELTIYVPSEASIRPSMMHSEDQLNRELGKKVPTSLEFKTFFQQSHRFAKLLVFLSIDKQSPDETFSVSDLVRVVENELNYIDNPEVIQREVDDILAVGIAIGFVGEVAKGRYKIKSRYKTANSREVDLIDKWTEFRLLRKEREDVDRALDELQSKYRKLREESGDLRRYLPS